MNNNKKVVHDGVSFKKGSFKNDRTMVEKLPDDLKQQILAYLREPEPGLIGGVELIDPVTGIRYAHESEIRERDGFSWSSSVIYMLDKYDIRLSKEFLKMFT